MSAQKRQPGKMGRPSYFTPERQKAVLDAMKTSPNRRFICARAAISDTTLRKWLKAGREALEEGNTEDEFALFVLAFEAAEAEFLQGQIENVKAAAKDPKTWAAARWLLSTHYPKDFGERVALAHGINTW